MLSALSAPPLCHARDDTHSFPHPLSCVPFSSVADSLISSLKDGGALPPPLPSDPLPVDEARRVLSSVAFCMRTAFAEDRDSSGDDPFPVDSLPHPQSYLDLCCGMVEWAMSTRNVVDPTWRPHRSLVEECTSIYVSTCRICYSHKVDAAPYLIRLRETDLLLRFPIDGTHLSHTSARDKEMLMAYGVIGPDPALCIPAHQLEDEEEDWDGPEVMAEEMAEEMAEKMEEMEAFL